jgi:hypothetical protein
MKTKIAFSFLLLFILSIPILSIPQISHAQECTSGLVPCGRDCNNPNTANDETKPCRLCHLIVGIWNIIQYAWKIMVFVALTGLVIAGIMYIVSAGNEQMITAAKGFIKNILAGFAIVLVAYLIIYTTMSWIAVKPDRGINKTSWFSFECTDAM